MVFPGLSIPVADDMTGYARGNQPGFCLAGPKGKPGTDEETCLVIRSFIRQPGREAAFRRGNGLQDPEPARFPGV